MYYCGQLFQHTSKKISLAIHQEINLDDTSVITRDQKINLDDTSVVTRDQQINLDDTSVVKRDQQINCQVV